MINIITVLAMYNWCILDKETKSENIKNIWPSYCYRIKIIILTNYTHLNYILIFQDIVWATLRVTRTAIEKIGTPLSRPCQAGQTFLKNSDSAVSLTLKRLNLFML